MKKQPARGQRQGRPSIDWQGHTLKLSVLIPVYNEKNTLLDIIKRVEAVPIEKEIIIVDDFSTDGTREIMKGIDSPDIKIYYHPHNRGKGAAIRTAIPHATGDIVLIQDADLEYDPMDYPGLIEPILDGRADVVYGSRFLGTHRAFLFWHYIGNKFLSFLTNLLYNTMLTDMETCYKVFRSDVIKGLNLKSDRFQIEPEITAKVFKKGHKVFEVPISYAGRDFKEGKKITWRDGIWAVMTLVKYRFVD